MEDENTTFNYDNFRKKWDNYLDHQKYKQAETLCHDALSSSPDDKSRGRLYNHLGFLYENFLEDKTFDDILEHYVLSLQVDESNSNSHYNLSNFLLEQGMQHLLRSLELNSNHKKARKRLLGLQPIRPGAELQLNGQQFKITDVTDFTIKGYKIGSKKKESIDIIVNSNGLNEDEMKFNDNGNQQSNNIGAMNVETNYFNDNNNNNNNSVQLNSFQKCILNPFLWFCIFFINLAAMALIVLGYLNFDPFTLCQSTGIDIIKQYSIYYGAFFAPVILFNFLLFFALIKLFNGCCCYNPTSTNLKQSQQQSEM